MSTSRNDSHAAVARTLDARSLALSALLGTHPPVLPGRALIALAELFGIAGGTMRTALSRMVAAGELIAADGRYRLVGRLLDRQRAQDLGRRAPDPTWDGGWHTAIALDARRTLADRRRVRRVMSDHRMGELRPDVWMRPTNLPAPEADGWACTTGRLRGAEPAHLAGRLWDLEAHAAAGRALLVDLDGVAAPAATGTADTIPATFHVAARTVRYLRADPLLPGALLPSGWPVDEVRTAYDAVERDLQSALRAFFASGG